MNDATARLDQLNIVAGDMRASMDFYRRLGVRMPAPDADAVPFHVNGEAAGGVGLELDSAPFAQVWNAAWAGSSDLVGRVVIGFRFATRERIDAIYRELMEAGYRSLAAPFDAFWGARYAIVEDPNGVAVGLMSPIDARQKYWPPESWQA